MPDLSRGVHRIVVPPARFLYRSTEPGPCVQSHLLTDQCGFRKRVKLPPYRGETGSALES